MAGFKQMETFKRKKNEMSLHEIVKWKVVVKL